MDAKEINEEEFENQLGAIMRGEKQAPKPRKKWGKKKKIIVFGGVAAAVILFFIATGNKGGYKMSVITAPVERGTIVETLSLNGPIEGTDSVEVVSNLHAEILEIPVKEGQKVEKDQLLALLDDTDIEKEVAIARNAYEQTASTYEDKKKEVTLGYAKAVQDCETQQRNYNRINALYQSGAASQEELENASNALNDAVRSRDGYTVVNGKAVPDKTYELQIESSKFELDKREKMLEDTQIKSPIAGTVVRVNTKVGRFADVTDDTNKPLFIIENLDVLEMKINVSEYSIGKVKIGQEVKISADILNEKTVEGIVTSISPTGEEKGGGSTERVIPITIEIREQNSGLISGITAKAEIQLSEAEDVLYVPVSALLQKDDGLYLALADNNKVRFVHVETGVESDVMAEVKPVGEQKLEEGMQVILSPSSDLTEGMEVSVMPEV